MGSNFSAASRALLSAAAFVIVVAGMKAAASLLVPFLLSVLIALVCSPAVAWLRRRRVPNALAIILIMLAIVAMGSLIGVIVNASITDFRAQLPSYQARLQEMSISVQQWLAAQGIHIDPQQWQDSFNPGVVMQLVGNVLASFGSVMTNAFLILFTVVFMLAETTSFRQRLSRARGQPDGSIAALERFSDSVNRYFGLKTLLSLLTGVLIAVWLSILGVNYAVMWGLLAFLLNFVPTIGSSLAAIPPMLLALIQLSPLSAGLVAAGFMLVNFVIDKFFTAADHGARARSVHPGGIPVADLLGLGAGAGGHALVDPAHDHGQDRARERPQHQLDRHHAGRRRERRRRSRPRCLTLARPQRICTQSSSPSCAGFCPLPA